MESNNAIKIAKRELIRKKKNKIMKEEIGFKEDVYLIDSGLNELLEEKEIKKKEFNDAEKIVPLLCKLTKDNVLKRKDIESFIDENFKEYKIENLLEDKKINPGVISITQYGEPVFQKGEILEDQKKIEKLYSEFGCLIFKNIRNNEISLKSCMKDFNINENNIEFKKNNEDLINKELKENKSSIFLGTFNTQESFQPNLIKDVSIALERSIDNPNYNLHCIGSSNNNKYNIFCINPKDEIIEEIRENVEKEVEKGLSRKNAKKKVIKEKIKKIKLNRFNKLEVKDGIMYVNGKDENGKFFLKKIDIPNERINLINNELNNIKLSNDLYDYHKFTCKFPIEEKIRKEVEKEIEKKILENDDFF